MALLKLYETHKLLSDLLARDDLDQAYQLTTKYMEALDDGFLRFQYLCLAVRLGQIESALDWLENSLNTEHWFSAWFYAAATVFNLFSICPDSRSAFRIWKK